MLRVSELAEQMRPFLLGWISGADGSGALALGPANYPDALLRNGSRSLLGNLAVGSGITIDGVDVDVFQANTLAWQIGHLAAADPHTQYVLETTQVVSGNGLTGGGDLSASRTLDVGAGAGINVNADDVAVNQAYAFNWTGAHVFGASATFKGAISETTTGFANVRVGINGTPRIILDEGSSQWEIDSSSNVFRLFVPGSLKWSLDASGNVTQVGAIGTGNYVSQSTGWRIDNAGAADFRYLFVDEMHAKSFIADLEQALAGGQIISKSVAMVGKIFTAPATGAATTLWVRDLPSAPNMAAFQPGDVVRLRNFTRSAGSLSISDCWGVVTAYADGADADEGLQSWTFTRSSAPNAGAMVAGTTVAIDAIVLDYGTSGNGIWETNAIDGAYAANSPYTQAVQWTGHPATGSVVRYRAGKLDGWGSGYAGTNTFGFVAGNAAGTWIATEATNGFRIMSGTNPVVQVDTSGAFLFRGAPSASVNVGALRWNPSSYVFEGGYYAPVAGPAYGAFTQQWKTDAATGEIVAGAGDVRIGLGGITLNGGYGSRTTTAQLKFGNTYSQYLGAYGWTSGATSGLTFENFGYTEHPTRIDILSYAITGVGGVDGSIFLRANSNAWQSRIDIGALAGIKYHSGASRHYFTDIDFSTYIGSGNGLRVGIAWNMEGIYAEEGACVVGGASGVNLQNGVVRVTSGVGILRAPIDATYNALAVNGGVHLTGSNTTYQMDARDNSGQNWQAYAESNNYRIWVTGVGDVVRFDTSGNASKLSAGTAWTSFSDARVKNVSGEYVGGLAEILRIRPIVYDYNGLGGTIPNGKRNAGIIAQEIREIFPDAVSEDRDTGLLMFDATEITWALVNAVKELAAQIKK